MEDNSFDLDWKVDELAKQGVISNFGRTQVAEVLQALLDLAGGQRRILLSMDEGFRFENTVCRLRGRIDSLSRGKNQKKTKELDALAVEVLRLWVSKI